MRFAVLIFACMLMVPAAARAQTAASPEDEAYCEQYYRFGAAGRLNCVLNSRIRSHAYRPYRPQPPGYFRY